MSTTETQAKPQEDPTRPANVLIGSCPSDTLDKAVAVLLSIESVSLAEMPEAVSLGVYLSILNVREALEWERERVAYKRVTPAPAAEEGS